MTALYFFLALMITWALDLPAFLASMRIIAPRGAYLGLVALGTFGPMLAAMVAARLEGTGVRALFRPLSKWRVAARWYLAALATPAATFVMAAAAYNLVGQAEPLLYPPERPGKILGAAVFALGEEVGWRGFALPRLRDRYGPVVASAIIGLLWAVWLFPLLAIQGASAAEYVILVPGTIGCSLMFGWIFQRTDGSLLLAVLTYVGVHLNHPGRLLPGRSTPFVIQMVSYALLGIGLALLLRRGTVSKSAERSPDLGLGS
jgi:membrane protease YdiL (CAAX protease family)